MLLLVLLIKETMGECALSRQGDGTCDRMCMSEAGSYDTRNLGSSDCEMSCLTHCSPELLTNGLCDPQCQTWDCQWDHGDCQFCAPLCDTAMLGNNNCEAQCNVWGCGWDLGDCSSQTNPVQVYVGGSDAAGDGSEVHPFASLTETLEALFLPYNHLHLLSGTHTLTSSGSPLLTQWSLAHTTIEGAACQETCPSIIQLTSNFAYFRLSHNVTFLNIHFDSAYDLTASCTGETCHYCPYLEQSNSGDWVNDRGEVVDPVLYADQSVCDAYHSTVFVATTASLWLVNVSFEGFRQQLQALVTTECGDLILQNVNVTNCLSSPTGVSTGLIQHFCPSEYLPYHCGRISYTSGTVSLLNNGYEYRSDIVQSGFLTAQGIAKVQLIDVKFLSNLVLIGENIHLTHGFLHFTNFREVLLQDCSFTSIISYSAVISVASDFEFPLIFQNNLATEQSLTHFILKNSDFTSISVLNDSIIDLEYATSHQNILIENITLADCVSSQSLLHVFNVESENEDKEGEIRRISGGSVYFPPRFVTISGVTAVGNVCEGGIFASNVGNLAILSTAFSNNGEMRDNLPPFSANFANFASISDTYLQLTPDLSVKVVCDAVFSLSNIFNLTFTESNLTSNYCPNGISGLYLTGNTTYLTLYNDNFAYNEGSGALTLQVSQPITLFNLTFIGNVKIEGHKPVCLDLEMQEITDVTIRNCRFVENSGLFSPVGFVDNVRSLFLDHLEVLNNTALFRCAGLTFNPSASSHSSFTLRNSVFRNNTAAGYGVVTVMDYYGVLNGNAYEELKIEIEDCEFTGNSAGRMGAAVTVADFVDLSLDSVIMNCTFSDNQAKQGAAIVATFQAGLLTIQNCLFLRNSAPLGAAVYVSTTVAKGKITSVEYRNCVFRGQKQGPAVQVQGITDVTNVSSYFNRIEDGVGGVEVYLADFYDEGSVYTGQYTREGPGMYIGDYSNVRLYGVEGYSNQAWGSGGVIYLTGHSNLTVTSCYFHDNTAANRGGVLYVDQVSIAELVNTTMSYNNATVASAIFVSPGTLYLTDSTIAYNHVSDFGSIYLSQCVAYVTSSSIHSNTSPKNCPGFILSNCEITMTKVVMRDQRGNCGGFIQGLDHNTLRIYDSNFTRGSVGLMGGAIYASTQTNIYASNCQFEECYSDQEGGVIESQSSEIQLTNCVIRNTGATTVGGVIVARETSVQIDSSLIENTYPVALYLFSSPSVEISYTVLRNSSSNEGGAIEFRNVPYSALEGNQFIHCNGTTGGALHYISESTLQIRDLHTIKNNTFRSNIATNGGALYAEEVDLTLVNNTFSENTAVSGGALVTKCAVQTWCNVTIKNNYFLNNEASKEGGAFMWSGAFPTTSGNLYEGNKAKYAETVGSYPVRIALMDSAGASAESLGTVFDLPLIHRLTDVASGQTYSGSFSLGLYDHRGFLVTTDDSSEAYLFTLNETNFALSGATMQGAKEGKFTFSKFGLIAEPGSTQYILVSTTGVNPALHVKSRDNTTYWHDVLIEVQFRKCISGESEDNGICFVCSAGTYSLDPSLPCLLCPSQAICYGNNTMVPKPGYWRMRNDTDVFIECLAPEACIGSPDPPFLALTGQCATGYKGNLCQQCESGFSSTGRFLCSKCPGMVSNVTLTLLICFLSLTVVALVVWTAVRTAMRPQSLIAVYVKIFMNYLQMVVVSAALNLNWPTFAKTFLSGQQMVGGMAEQLFSVDCLIKGDGMSFESLYFTKIKMYSALPLVLFLLGVVTWLVISVFTKVEHLLRKLAATAVIVIFILHPSVTKMVFSLFSCMSLGDNHTYLVNDLSVICWETDHLMQIFTVVLPTLIIIVFGLPILTMLILINRRMHLESSGIKLMLCFLYKGYVRNRYYWEFFILYRKVAMIAASVFLAQVSIRMQALTVLAILLLSLFLQLQVNPFFDTNLNRLEVKAILVSAITIYSGLYYDTNQLSILLKVLLFTVMVTANAYFLFSWLRLVSPVLMKTLRERLQAFFNWRKSYRIRAMGALPDQSEKPSSMVNFSSDMTNPHQSIIDPSSELHSGATPVDPPNTSMIIPREYTEEEAKEPVHYSLAD